MDTKIAGETLLDKIVKIIKIISQLVWLAIGVITLIATIQLYSLAKSGALTEKIQELITGSISAQTENMSDTKGLLGTDGLSATELQQLQQLQSKNK